MRKHGGVRKGAGRPSAYGEATKPMRLPISLVPLVQEFIQNNGHQLPLFDAKVPAGTPAALAEPTVETINLFDYLIKKPADTFLVRAIGDSMINIGIHDNDILIVDRTVTPVSGKVVIAAVDAQLTVKTLYRDSSEKLFLVPQNDKYPAIEITAEQSIVIYGVVTNVIHSV